MAAHRISLDARIDRGRPLAFRFNGKRLQGFHGDTLASALLANDVSIVGRSFKLHRPRGIVAAGAEEPNAILQIGEGAASQPNLRATQVELYEGLAAYSVRGWPGPGWDLGAVNGLLGRMFSAGFYYKTFMWPPRGWPFYEKMIRATAGLGAAPSGPDPDQYRHRNAHCDMLVAGAGPAGLMAALTGARSGARVIIADEQDEFGGSLLASVGNMDGQAPVDWVADVVAELAQSDKVVMLPRSTVFGYYDHNFLAIAERCTDHLAAVPAGAVRQRLWRVRARQVVLAQGAIERPLVFCNNDRPGVMLASAVSTYIRRYAVCPGRRAVVFTNNDSAYQSALDLVAGGSRVTVVDARAGGARELGEQVSAAGVSVLPGHIVTDVTGGRRARGVRIMARDGEAGARPVQTRRLPCDLVAMSGGWNPSVHLHAQSGGGLAWDTDKVCFVPAGAAQAQVSAGAGRGHWSLRECLADGVRAGRHAVTECGFNAADIEPPQVTTPKSNPVEALWRVPARREAARCHQQFLDFQNDTSVADIHQAVREGYRDVEHVKRYTALGFGTDQGKLGNINGMAVLADALGEPASVVGTTTFRPAYTPVSFGVCAGESVGDLHDPVRTTALHDWHERAAAPMEPVGQWHRPWYFPREGEDLHAAVARECLATRAAVGIMDASTLGKIGVRGPGATEFLERLYTHDVASMQIGQCAYGVLLGEDGMVMDDGVVSRLEAQHFFCTTTTGGAARVLDWMEKWLQTEWPDLEVYLTSLTDPLSTIAVAGPLSRQLLERVGCGADLAGAAFPFMRTLETDLSGLPVRLFRVSFSGELAFEINVDSACALGLWEVLMDAGEAFGITPYGTESMHVLRAEKGYVIVGQDTDGSVTPVDLGMDWLLSGHKDFLGKRSLQRPDCQRPDRKQWVGLSSVDSDRRVPEGAQLVDGPVAEQPASMCGHVTSSYYSACLQRPLALGLLAGGRGRHDETLHAVADGCDPIAVKVVPPVFYDPGGARQRD